MKKVFAAVAAAALMSGCGAKNEEVSTTSVETSKFVTESGLALKEGVHYKEYEPMDRDMEELTVLFWYGCPHCQTMRDPLAEFEKKTGMNADERHALFSEAWVEDAMFFYTAKQHLMKGNALSEAYFDARTFQSNALSVGEIESLVGRFGMDLDAFTSKVSKELTEAEIDRTKRIQKHYKIAGVPSLIVNGRYVINNPEYQSYQQIFEAVEVITGTEQGDAPSGDARAKDAEIEALQEPAVPTKQD